jgi:hypothetical protein
VSLLWFQKFGQYFHEFHGFCGTLVWQGGKRLPKYF